MPDFSVIADASETLRKVLADGLGGLIAPSQVVLHDFRDPVGQNDLRLTVFLFEVVEDPAARNRPRQRALQGSHMQVKKPRQALLLRYLITPWSPNPATEHTLLGRVAQILYERPILKGNDLQGGSLQGSGEALKLSLAPLSLEERTRVWHAVQQPYRLSLSYEVRVVNIDPVESDEVAVVSSRDLRFGGLEPAP